MKYLPLWAAGCAPSLWALPVFIKCAAQIHPPLPYLWLTLWPPRRRSSAAVAPGQGCLRSSWRRSCCRRWPCRRPGSSGLRRHSGGPPPSCGPAGPPAAGCHPAVGSDTHTHTQTQTNTQTHVWEHTDRHTHTHTHKKKTTRQLKKDYLLIIKQNITFKHMN